MGTIQLNKLAIMIAISPSLCFAQSASSAKQADEVKLFVTSSSAGDSAASIPSSGAITRTGNTDLIVKIRNSCFGTNLRGVTNPIAPSSIITSNITINVDGKDIPLRVEYPAELVTAAGMTSGTVSALNASKYSIPGGGKAAIYGNTIQLNVPVKTVLTIDPTGQYIQPKTNVHVKGYSFTQTVTACGGPAIYGQYGHSAHTPTYNCGDYMGKNGPLSASIGGLSVAPDQSVVEVSVAFPGQTGFCGSYWSPLMLFTTDERPTFKNISSFPLNPLGQTHWPEAKAPGYFVAFDRDKNGLIDQKNELFGDSENVENGFIALKEFDSNKDGVVDRKDKNFKKLVLWNDLNGDGVSQKNEITPLQEMVKTVSLAYEKGRLRPLGDYAEEREASWAVLKNGKKATVVDIWFSPAPMKLSGL